MARAKNLEIIVKNLSDYLDKITEYAQNDFQFNCYRGQQVSSWSAVPSLLRSDRVGLATYEKMAIRDLMSVHPKEFSEDRTMFDRLVRMQHYGLPTRLMDVSVNPLVALYFATESDENYNTSDGKVVAFSIPPEREKYYDSDAVSCIANLANMAMEEKQAIIALRGARVIKTPTEVERQRINASPVIQRLHQFIREEKPYFLPIIHPVDLFKPYYVHPKMSNRRIIAQAGGFIIHGLTPPRPINFKKKIENTEFLIPAKAKPEIRAALNLLGINESTLFPELDRAAKRIKVQYSAL